MRQCGGGAETSPWIEQTSMAHSRARLSVSTNIIVFWGFYSPFPDIVLFYVKFIGGGIGIENVYDDDQFCTFGLHCGLKRTVLFQGIKDE